METRGIRGKPTEEEPPAFRILDILTQMVYPSHRPGFCCSNCRMRPSMVRSFPWMTEIVGGRHLYWFKKKLNVGEGHPAGDAPPLVLL